MPLKRAARKRQTRLSLTPLPSSSPKAAELHPDVQFRAAAVRYGDHGSPTKRRRLDMLDNLARSSTSITAPSIQKDDSVGLPTPQGSSQSKQTRRASGSDAEDEVGSTSDSDASISSEGDKTAALPSSTTMFPRRVQTRLTGNGSIPSTWTKDALSASKPLAPSMFRSSQKKQLVDPTTKDRSTSRKTAGGSTEKSKVTQIGRVPAQRSVSSSNSRESLFGRSSSSESEDSNGEAQAYKESKVSAAVPTESHPYEADTLTRLSMPTTISYGPSKAATKPASESSEDDEDDIITSSLRSLRKPLKANAGELSSSTPKKTEPPSRSTKSKKDVQTAVEMSSSVTRSSESDASAISPIRIPRLTRPNTSPPESSLRKQEQEDLYEDVELLKDEVVITKRTRGNERSRPSQRDIKKLHLERLRAKREGRQTVDLSVDTAGYTDDSTASDDSDDDPKRQAEEADSRASVSVRQGLDDEEDGSDANFVVEDEDEDDDLGVPSELNKIPLEFTRHAHKTTKEHFKDVIEWMVHKKLNPGFTSNDPLYQIGFHKIGDQVQGYSGSKFVSAAWAGDFHRAIKSRPRCQEVPVVNDVGHKCDACNRSNHPAAFRITFSGKAYDPDSLESLKEDVVSDEDDDGEDSVTSCDRDGRPLPSADKDYYVGKFCRANAVTAHALLHWKYHLNEWVLDWLQSQGHLSADKIVQREKWSIARRGKYANQVVDRMEETKAIKGLYRDFKAVLETARDQQPEAFANRRRR